MNDENLIFFSEIEAYKAMKGSTKSPPESLLVLSQSARNDEGQLVEELIETFVKDDSPKQVNISAAQREKILYATKDHAVGPTIFQEAQTEVKKLMQNDAWPRFMHRMLDAENLSLETRVDRFKRGLLSLAVYLLAFGLFLGLFVPRWYFFFLAIPIGIFLFSFISFQSKTCVIRAYRHEVDIDGKRSDQVKVQCPTVRYNTRNRARKLIALMIVLTIVWTGFSFAMTYAVEAGQSKVLYG
jgi:hypothetical protein